MTDSHEEQVEGWRQVRQMSYQMLDGAKHEDHMTLLRANVDRWAAELRDAGFTPEERAATVAVFMMAQAAEDPIWRLIDVVNPSIKKLLVLGSVFKAFENASRDV